jgi:hypothetical protein
MRRHCDELPVGRLQCLRCWHLQLPMIRTRIQLVRVVDSTRSKRWLHRHISDCGLYNLTDLLCKHDKDPARAAFSDCEVAAQSGIMKWATADW